MSELSYDPGALNGDRRDPSLARVQVRELDDAQVGRLLKALGAAAASYRESERRTRIPVPVLGETPFQEGLKQHERFDEYMDALDRHIGSILVEAIDEADSDPRTLTMYSTSAIFKEGEPVLFYRHWGTYDLEEDGRDEQEFNLFIGLNGFLGTAAGKRLAHDVIDEVMDGATMSDPHIPNDWNTLGTTGGEIFEPFVRATA